ncbi:MULTISPECIES: hypothetical protein [unclassified Streptomyces]|uniref:hypothetical protein n=1 Tax=unclassified Streptomyces TaxID=2593676 RepID=UPI0004C52480|nr:MULTISPECIES: hypothetical protein [unclassified Streptomyces]RPF35063.1 hypothetical protein EDD92_5058 [Streptomyces sp. TLI_185]
MVRARSGAFPADMVLVAVLVSACGAAAPQTPRKELFQEYVRSTHLQNDWSGGEGGKSADRIANFGSRGMPTDLLFSLLFARQRDADADSSPSGAARQAVTALVGFRGRTHSGGLDDFRHHHDLLGSDDVILTRADITSVSSGGKVVVAHRRTGEVRP